MAAENVKLLVDESCLRVLQDIGPDNVADFFAGYLGLDVVLVKTRCLELFFDAKEHCCLHSKTEAGRYIRCLKFLLGRSNPKRYYLATTAGSAHEYNNVANLHVIIVAPNGHMVLRGPPACVEVDEKEARTETKTMNNKIKRARAALNAA